MLQLLHETLSFATVFAMISDMRKENQITKKSGQQIGNNKKTSIFKLNFKNIHKCIFILCNLPFLDFPAPSSLFGIRLLGLGFRGFFAIYH